MKAYLPEKRVDSFEFFFFFFERQYLGWNQMDFSVIPNSVTSQACDVGQAIQSF